MKKINTMIVVLVLLYSFVNNVQAQTAIYLKIAGINGEVTTPAAYANTVLVTASSSGVTSPATIPSGTGAGQGKATFQNLNFVMPLNAASTPLMGKMVAGATIATLDVTYVNAGCSCPYYKIHLEGVYVTSLTDGVSSTDSTLTQQVSFAYSKIAWAYYAPNSTTVTNQFGWNLATYTAYSYTF